jgi:membrane-associated phospholipid phosphatase
MGWSGSTTPFVVAVLAAAVLAVLIQNVVTRGGLTRLDPHVENLVLAHRSTLASTLMKVLTWLGSTVVVTPLAMLTAGWFLLRRRDWRPVVFLVAAIGGAIGLYDIVKAATGRMRPPPATWIGHYSGGSFPSGHATQAVASYAMLALLLSAGRSTKARAWLWTAATIVMLVVGFSRVYLGAHWFTDVIGGYALGIVWVAIIVTVASMTLRHDGAPPRTGENPDMVLKARGTRP